MTPHRSAARSGTIALLAIGAVLVGAVPGAAAPGASGSAELAAATAIRERAEARLADLERRRAEVAARLDAASAESRAIAEELVAARARLRDRAVQLFVAGDVDVTVLAVLDAQELTDAVDRRSMAGVGALDAAADLARYRRLKDDHDPALVRLAAELGQVEQQLADADDAALQARAVEADAERKDAQRRAEAAAAELAAARRAASTTTTAPPAAAPPVVAAARTAGPAEVQGGAEAPGAPLPDPPPVSPPESAWAALRDCESGGNYRIVSASGRYRGAYQFDVRTWQSVGGAGDPAMASPAEQDVRAKLLYARRGARAWPVCGRHLRG